MSGADLFAQIADERRGLADLFAAASEQDLRARSLCPAWTVHDVLAHLVTPLAVGLPRMVLAVALAGGDFDRANRRVTRRLARRSREDLVDALRRGADSRFTPPGAGPEAPLVDVLVHGLDVRRPLGVRREVPAARARPALSFLLTAPKGLVPAGLLDGVRVEVEDVDLRHGNGAPVRGPADDVLLVLTGRRAGLDGLTGAGADLLARRLG
ncbi:maleylpyruvate isomerase family mycothiol-dependent enzyme [Kineococcus sp. LSe6-4]|uniref:Maleylpyruvate isomerase family mycothiol-dependent enzyme n=1 Tax=Kineococcus halophytocola TaxID=3234027 RepID=A0ABV4H6V5_9ACTN